MNEVQGTSGGSATVREWSLRRQLLLLVLAVVLPLMGLQIYLVSRHAVHDTYQVYDLVQRYALGAAADSAHFIADTTTTLSRVAASSEAQHPDAVTCPRALSDLIQANPDFVSATIVNLRDGTSPCTSPSASAGGRLVVPPEFIKALGTGRSALTPSPPFFDPAAGHWKMAFAYPIRNSEGVRSAAILIVDLVAGAGLHYRTSLVSESLPPGSTTAIIDDNDQRVLDRWPNPERWVAVNASGVPVVNYAVRASAPTHVTSRGLDGRERVYGISPITGTHWHLYVGIPVDVATAPSQRFARQITLTTLGGAALLTIFVALFGTYIASPLRALARSASAAGEGNLRVRAPISGSGETRTAAYHFNHLLAQRQQIEVGLADQKRRAEMTLHSIGDAVVRIDNEAHITYLNPAAESLTGWRLDEAIGQPLFDVVRLVYESDHRAIRKSLELALAEGALVDLGANTLLIARDGREYDVADTTAPLTDPSRGTVGAVLVFRDISATRELERRLSWQALHDGLTGLVNRVEFEHRVIEAMDDAKAHGGKHVLLYVDLDQFKAVNDTAGHPAGDELLRRLAEMLKRLVPPEHTIARVGGDEFCVLLKDVADDDAEQTADQIRRSIQDFRFAWDGGTFAVGASIGLVKIDADANSLEEVMKAADFACYMAKERGRNRIHVFAPDDRTARDPQEEPAWARRIHKGLEEHRFRLFTQAIVPIVATASEPVFHEILIRLCDERGHLLPPTSFLPAAHRYNMLTTLDRWVIATSFKQMKRISNDVHFSVNLSGHSISDDRFLDFVLDQFEQTGLAPAQVCFEITESAAVVNLNRATHFMSQLRAKGARFALDDFGIGISSLAYLRSLPVDIIKIDGRFVRNVDRDHIDHAMVEAIIRIGRVMHLKTVAEFVENERTRTYVQALGVDYAQGYGVSEPRPIEEILNAPPVAGCGNA